MVTHYRTVTPVTAVTFSRDAITLALPIAPLPFCCGWVICLARALGRLEPRHRQNGLRDGARLNLKSNPRGEQKEVLCCATLVRECSRCKHPIDLSEGLSYVPNAR